MRVSRTEALSPVMARCPPARAFAIQLADVFVLWKISQSRRRLTMPGAACLGCQLKVRAEAGSPRCGAARSDSPGEICYVICGWLHSGEFVLCTLLGRALLPVVVGNPVDR